jgi:MFS family permease
MSLYAIARLAFAGTALSIIPLALLPPLPIMVLAALGLGLSWGPMYPLINTVIQRRVPADEQGRVFGAQTALFYAAPPLAMVAVGAAVGEFGVSATYLTLGVLLAAACVAAIFVPSIREVND